MKILIADKFSENAIEELRGLGLTVEYHPDLKEQALLEALGQQKPVVLVVRSTKVTKEMLEAGDSLLLVVRAGAGVNTIDVQTASRLGIYVANCPGKNSIAVAELVFGLLLSLDRHIPDNVSALREGIWNKKKFSVAKGIRGLTLGLIGFGSIAREVAMRARVFEMEVVCWGRSVSDEVAEAHDVTPLASPIAVARQSDVVSVHVAATEATRSLCNGTFFAAMKNGAYFINTSRGDVVDEEALKKAIEQKHIRAALDVFQNEPSSGECAWKSAIASHPMVYGTHHIGASTHEAEREIGKEALRIIRTFALSGEVLNCVNLDVHTPATHVMSVRHLNQVGVLAAVLSEIQKNNINVFEMENSIFYGDEAACAKMRLNKKPNPETIAAIKKAHKAIISVSVSEVGE